MRRLDLGERGVGLGLWPLFGLMMVCVKVRIYEGEHVSDTAGVLRIPCVEVGKVGWKGGAWRPYFRIGCGLVAEYDTRVVF